MYISQKTSAPHTLTSLLEKEAKTHTSSMARYLRDMSEAILGLGVVFGLGWFLPNLLSSQIIFFLFFLIVFAIAVRYQRGSAYSTGLLATTGYIGLLWPHGAILLNSPHTLIGPFLLLLSSVVTGDLLHIQRRQFETAKDFSQRTDKVLQETVQQHQQALSINTELEQQIAGQKTSMMTVSEQTRRLLAAKGNARYGAIVEMLQHTLETQSCAIYLRDGEQMRLYGALPEKQSERKATLDMKELFVNRVLRKQAIVTVRELMAEEMLPEQMMPLMAGPLLDQSGQVVGIVVIEQMPLLKCTPGAERLFGSLLHLASQALASSQTGRNRNLSTAEHPTYSVLVG